jgi:hypothetical protein
MAWRNDELKYIEHLLMLRGNASVPRSAIPSYLQTQYVHARMDGEHAIAVALTVAMECARKGNYGDALRAIREARAGEPE